MLNKTIMLFFLYSISCCSEANTVSLVCPFSSQLERQASQGSWATYHYQGYSQVAIPELGNRVALMGETNSETAGDFYAATWTDQTFLCLYKGVVTYETVLYPFVNRCYFENSAIPSRTECLSADPALCPLTCELKSF